MNCDTPQQPTVKCTCPHCHASLDIVRPSKDGSFKYTCSHCERSFAITFKRQPTDAVQPSKTKLVVSDRSQLRLTVGGLIEKRGFWHKDTVHPLHVGRQTIGRRDGHEPSDIMIDDAAMSRKSVRIDVYKTSVTEPPSYELTVVKSKNPVFVINVEIKEGESVFLTLGCTLRMGLTSFRLQ